MDKPSSPKKVFDIMSFIYEGTDKQKFGGFLELIKKIVTNIINNPDEPKYKNIKKSNKVLLEKLFVHPNIHELLLSLQFQLNGDVYSYSNQQIKPLADFEIIIEGFEVQLQTYFNNLGVDEEVAHRRQKLIEDENQLKQSEIDKLEQQAHLDRIEKAKELKDRPPCDSIGKDLKFGATVKTTKEICPPQSR